MNAISVDTYRRHIQQACGSGGYFMFLRVFARVLDKVTALFLQDLINRGQMQAEKSTKKHQKVDADGFFFCPGKYLSNRDYMEWSDKEQKKAFLILKRRDFVKVQLRGLPAQRWVWIDYVKIWREIDRVCGVESSETAKLVSHPTNLSVSHPTNYSYKKNTTSCHSSEIQNNVAPAGARDATERDGIMFFEDLKPTPKPSETFEEFDSKCSEDLRDILKSKKITCPYSKKKWSIQFRMLRSTVGGDKDRILRVLKWYSKAIGAKYIPQALCATSFRKKFDKLEASMRRESPVEEDVEISPTTLKIMEHISSKFWPKGSAAKLPIGIEVSIRNLRSLLSKLSHLVDSDRPVNQTVRGFARDTISRIDSPTNFIHWWFAQVNEMVTDWEKWSGDLRPFYFSLDSKQFQKLGATWAREYSTDERLWTRFMEEVSK